MRNAYRARARETHPDKHPGNEAEMHAKFLEVVAAFELLSDATERALYDRTGTTTTGARRGAAPGPRKPRGARNLTPEEARAAARTITIRSRKHLEDAALGDDGRVDRHFVLALYDEGFCETFLTYETRFPYPFADKLDPHGIWWEDVLQTAKARLTGADGQPSRVARRFGVDPKSCPSIVFARNGSRLWDDFEVIAKPTLADFERWLWPKLETTVRFVNAHGHAVRTWWIRGTESFDAQDLGPGRASERTGFVSHLFAVRDVRAGGPLTKESVLAWRHVDSDANPFEIRVESKCVDWHGECGGWADRDECAKNPDFMAKFCHRTCAGRVAHVSGERAKAAGNAAAAAAARADDLKRAYDAALAEATTLRDDAVALEILAEADAHEALSCSPQYPEAVVRKW